MFRLWKNRIWKKKKIVCILKTKYQRDLLNQNVPIITKPINVRKINIFLVRQKVLLGRSQNPKITFLKNKTDVINYDTIINIKFTETHKVLDIISNIFFFLKNILPNYINKMTKTSRLHVWLNQILFEGVLCAWRMSHANAITSERTAKIKL